MKVYMLALLLVGCGSIENQEPDPSTNISDSTLNEYYTQFIQECKAVSHTLCATNTPKLRTIQFVDEKFIDDLAKNAGNPPPITKRVGVCVAEYRLDTITRSYVYILKHDGYNYAWHPDALRALVFHELGHCLLQLDHPSPARPSTDPAIMNSQMYSVKTYQLNWESMVAELFQH